ncbi:hypothetical protein [Fusibacter ferrireducens]|uniref:NYN domain-containing protein n=1 Tax=Fusibacter ferrireducens TaxID=2785058 RepID=A0ABR9ZYC8_9FIRM|nr:hypothetical protein [Fusibacter ferrireducens]MBF4695462.1 hypothetical protein [Fusibacter ferrireducens]
MTEALWIYTTTPQLKIVQEITENYPQAYITENESQIVIQSKVNAVIVISQLSHDSQLKLNLENSYFYVGVRVQMGLFKAFENIFELSQHLNERRHALLHSVQRAYLQHLEPISLEDQKYLRRLTEHYDVLCDPKTSKALKKPGNQWGSGHNQRTNSRKVQYKNYKGIIAVYNCPQFAVSLAESFKVKSLLLMDGNLLKPTLDEYLGINKIETNVESHLTGIDNTGLNIALDSLRKNTKIKHDLKHIVKKRHHYDVLLGNYNVLNYEHYDTSALNTLVETMANLYGCVIISLGDNLYDYMTLMCLNKSDINIICFQDNKSSVLWTKQMIEILKTKQFIEPVKHHLYKIKTPLRPKMYSESVMTSIFKSQYKGVVNLKQKRHFKKVIKELLK